MVKISNLPSDSTPTSTDYIVVHDAETGATKKVLLSNLFSQGMIPGTGMTDGAITSNKISGIDKSGLDTDINPYKIHAYRGTSNQTITTATWTTVQLQTEMFDTNNNFDTTTYRWTAPVNGFYQIIGQVYANSGDSAYAIVALYKNATSGITGGTILAEQRIVYAGNANKPNNCACFVQLVAGDWVTLVAYIEDTTTPTVLQGAGATFMSGFLVCRT